MRSAHYNVIKSLLCFLILLSFSCSEKESENADRHSKVYSPAQYLESALSESIIIPGVGLGKLRLGETRGEYLFNEKINGRVYIDNGIYLQFEKSDTLNGIEIENRRLYKTPEGKTIGLTEEGIVVELGEPNSRGTKLMKGDTQIGFLESLNYSGMKIYFLGDSIRVIQLFIE